MRKIPFHNIELGTLFRRYSNHSGRIEWYIKASENSAYCPMNHTRLGNIPETYMAEVL